MSLPDNIINVGRINNQKELATYYSMADLTVLTSKRETFSMICVESLSCGTPVVGFKAGVPEQISLKEFSKFVEYGDIDALEILVREWIYKKSEIKNVIEKQAHKRYSKVNITNKYIEIYKRLINYKQEGNEEL